MELFDLLRKKFPTLRLERAVRLSTQTTVGVGGYAKTLAVPASAEEAVALFKFIYEQKIPHYSLGVGANVLPSDADFDGVIVKFTLLNGIFRCGERIFAGAGVTGGAFGRFTEARQLGGAEWLTGIPTSIGGGIAMNAGVGEGHFEEIVDEVVAVEKGALRVIPQHDCQFSAKKSVFLSGIAVLGGYFQLKSSSSEEIARKKCYFRQKRAHLPKGKSMGCTFVNPTRGKTAGELLERCGLKGVRVGGAVFSTQHANFILNEGATSSQISSLIALAKKRVYEREGILLNEEIRRLIPIIL